MLWKSCSKFNFLQVFHSMFCKKIDILAVAKEKLCIATIFIRLINHLEIVIDIKYQYYQTIFRYKKAFLRFGCLCSNATVLVSVSKKVETGQYRNRYRKYETSMVSSRSRSRRQNYGIAIL